MIQNNSRIQVELVGCELTERQFFYIVGLNLLYPKILS